MATKVDSWKEMLTSCSQKYMKRSEKFDKRAKRWTVSWIRMSRTSYQCWTTRIIFVLICNQHWNINIATFRNCSQASRTCLTTTITPSTPCRPLKQKQTDFAMRLILFDAAAVINKNYYFLVVEHAIEQENERKILNKNKRSALNRCLLRLFENASRNELIFSPVLAFSFFPIQLHRGATEQQAANHANVKSKDMNNQSDMSLKIFLF